MERDLRRDALATARRLLEADGVRGVTPSAVARDLGVPDAELGRAGLDRVALLEALYESTMDRLLAFLGAAVAQQDPDDLAAQVEAGTHAIVVWCGTHRAGFDLLMGPGFRQAVGARAAVRQSVASRLGGAWVPLFDRVRRTGAPVRRARPTPTSRRSWPPSSACTGGCSCGPTPRWGTTCRWASST